MTAGKNNKIRVLIGLSAALVLIALVLSVISSRTAYALTNLNTLLLGAVAAIALDALVVLLGDKLPEAVRDVALLIAVFATSLAMCTLIGGRTTLAGYIYFSDLESNNPVAISAMNKAIGAVCAYLCAIVLTVIAGFMKTKKA